MAFGGSGFGSSGFGSSNTNNNSGSLFGSGGGFGNNNNTGGFGNQTSTGFGQNTANTGNSFGGFGSTNNNSNNAFGAAKPAFGTTTANSGGLFGSNNNSTGAFGSGGFGSTANTTTSGFGSNNTSGGGLFGNTAKPASTFGNNTGNSLFGGSSFGGSTAVNSTAGGTFGGSTAMSGPTGECQGTASPQYSVTQEKEGTSNIMNNFQSIVHLPAYQKWSFEELRLADYNAGRRFANANGQAGGFGVSNFGGLSNNNTQASGGLFGATNTNTNTTASGGLFGGNSGFGGGNTGFGSSPQTNNNLGGFGTKPATTSLFGNPNTTTATQGNLFGGSGGFGTNTSTGFGTNTAGTTGFGTTNTDKPALFNTPNTGGGLFGNNSTATNPTGNLFGAVNQPQNTGFGGNQPAATNNPFGSTTSGGGLFGNSTATKPGGLFGNTTTTNTGGGLFGSTQQTNQQSGGLFGNANPTANNPNSLFAPKPAVPSLFGAQPQQQNQGPSLFGSTPQNQPAQSGLGLFGNTAPKPANSLFGNPTTQNPAGSSLFGNAQPQQSQSIFGSSVNTNQPTNLQPPQALTASIYDNRPYGSVSIFDGLPPPPAQNVGPIATPISSGQKQRKPAVLPQWKLNPTMSPRFVTPQKQGYGFSYSRYGTPSSISSVASTPGQFGGSLLGSSIGRTLGKSVSVSNLRRTFDSDAESVLAPGAFTTSSRLGNQQSLKKLNIDRSLRNDLFAPVTQGSSSGDKDSRNSSALKKRVSFEASSLNTNGGTDEEVPQITQAESSPTPTAEEQGYLRSSTRRNIFNGQPARERHSQEASPVKGNELAIVPEDGSPEAPRASAPAPAASSSSSRPGDPEPGEYWLRPSLDEIKKMSPEQLKKVSGFIVGRHNVGQCAFQEPVDLSGINWNNFFDVVVQFGMRSICVYPEHSKKPPVGMGINVPAVITLENCWPRSRSVRSGPRLEKHIRHLQSVTDCEFIRYNVDNGEWVFKVPHFTTYGLDYEDEDEMETDAANFKSSVLSDAFSEIAPNFLQAAARRTNLLGSTSDIESHHNRNAHAGQSDQNQFKPKNLKHIPGGFDAVSDSGESEHDTEMQQVQDKMSFLDGRSAGTNSESEEEPAELDQGEVTDSESVIIQDADTDLDMAGAYPAEPSNMPKSILKQSMYEDDQLDGPQMFLGDDWAEQLQRTVSPRKRDRQNLRASQAVFFQDNGPDSINSPIKKSKNDKTTFRSSIDIMNSIFGQENQRKAMGGENTSRAKQGFQWPYNKNIDRESSQLDENEQAFHESFKPHWGPGDVLVHAISHTIGSVKEANTRSTEMQTADSLVSEGYDVRLSKFSTPADLIPAVYERQVSRSEIVIDDGVPRAKSLKLPLRNQDATSALSEEALVWNLAGVLFEEYEDALSGAVPAEQREHYASRIKKDRLSAFWRSICKDEASAAVQESKTAEERAVHFLAMGGVVEACAALTNGKDFRLATLISQIGGDEIMHQDMAQQIKEWRRLNVLSEMTDDIRTLYEMLAGNVCLCEGRQGPLEDRAATFTISQRYKLSWIRAFGLRLWYAISTDDPIEAAVKKYLSDLGGSETTNPQPRFMERIGDKPSEQREDVLWGILRLFADQDNSDATIRLSDVVAPENISSNPANNRLSWELYAALSPYLPREHSPEAADKLAVSFAAELESAKHWLWAVFVLLHINSADHRESAIRDLLTRQAGAINTENANIQQTLFEQFHIPPSWVYEAKALYARSVQHDRLKELHYLQQAGNWAEAHSVLCEVVAPQAIIERSYDMLSHVLAEFEHGQKPHTWRIGGAIYADYLALQSNPESQEQHHILNRLARSLPELAKSNKDTANKKRKGTAEKGPSSTSFLQRVAIQEMSSTVANLMGERSQHSSEHNLALHLPLSSERRRDRSGDLALAYYQKVMASG